MLDLVRPYRLPRDHRAREFAAWFWESVARDAEVACARADLGLGSDVDDWDLRASEYYLTYRQIYSERHRRGEPLRVERVTPSRSLRCVFFNESPEQLPHFPDRMAAMNRSFIPIGSRDYAVIGRGWKREDFVNLYRVYEFVPRPGVAVREIPRAPEETLTRVAGASGTIRR